MSHVSFPFKKLGSITIINGNSKNSIKSFQVEVAESTYEIFQSLNIRKISDFKKPLLLKIKDPWLQNFVLFDNEFPIEVLTFNSDNVLSNVFIIPAKSAGGFFIKSFSGFGMVLLSKPSDNISKKYNMVINHTSIALV